MLNGASGGECHPGERGLCCPSAPGHVLFSFNVLQLSKAKCANVVFVSDSFQGNCMQKRLK